MNMFPSDRPVYQKLNTSFTSYDALLEDLASRKLDGYLHLTHAGYQGTLFVVAGTPAGAMEEPGGAPRRMGPVAVDGFSQKVRERGGSIDVLELDPQLVPLLAGMADAFPMHLDLASEWTVFGRLVEALKLELPEGHLDLRMLDGSGEALVFFSHGRILAAMASRGGERLAGDEALAFVVDDAQKAPARLSVYRAAGARTETERREPAAVRFAPAVTRAVPLLRRSAPAEAEESPVLAAILEAERRQEPHAEPTPSPIVVAEPEQDGGRTETIGSWARVIHVVEELVDEIGKRGQFASAFHEALIENSATYPFLDPFGQQFEYRSGEIHLSGEVPASFAKALDSTLDDTVRRLTFLLRREDFETLVRNRITGAGRSANAHQERATPALVPLPRVS